jgi:hypothetical protein
MSDTDMLNAAEAEVQRLEAELEATPAYKKLQLAKQVVALYRSEAGIRINVKHVDPAALAFQRLHEMGNSATKTARIEAAAIKFLRAKKARATSGELLKAVEEAGIEITGKEPSKALSSYLSNSKALNNIRELGGYGLVEWGHAKGPDLLTKTGA